MVFDIIEKALKIPVYFARLDKVTDKPHIEHLNALIKQYLPKDSSFKDLSRKEIIKIEQKLNAKTRKKLNFQTPI